MASSEEQVLLRAVLEAPDEDAPRLAYADGCARRRDKDRAEFIRLQVELGRMNWGEPRGKPLYERMQALLQAALGRSEHLSRLENLYLGLGQPTGNKIRADGATGLAHAVFLPVLVELDLDFNLITDEGLNALVDARRTRKLQYLHLQGNELTDVSGVPLGASPMMETLVALDLRANRLGPASAEALARANPPRLTTLWLSANPIGDEGVRALARSPWMAQLRELNLDGTGMSDAGAEALLQSPHVDSIRKLICLKNELSEEMEQRLSRKFGSRLDRSFLSPSRPK